MTGVGTGTIYITGTLTGLAGGSKTINVGINLNTAISAEINTGVTSGYTPVQVPAGANGVIILPPAGNTVPVTLKGNSGDIGVGLHPTNPSLVSLTPFSGTFGLFSNVTITGTFDLLFF